jgi:hypothetical protein
VVAFVWSLRKAGVAAYRSMAKWIRRDANHIKGRY